MNRPVRRLAVIVFVAFAVLLGGLTYNQVIAGPGYRDDPRNARVIIYESGRERGGIVTADGVVLARSTGTAGDSPTYTRVYPEGEYYAHVVGFASALLEDRGLEATRAGELLSQRDATITGLLSAIAGEDLSPKGLRLTLHDRLQRVAFDALGDQAGAVVAIDPTTGAILAMVSRPSYDPGSLVRADAVLAGEALDADPARPLLNRAVAETYPPGSTFKVVTAAAAIEGGSAGPETSYPNPVELELPGSTATIRNFSGDRCGGDERATMRLALVASCNTVFGIIGMETGEGDLVTAAEQFGFNQIVPFELEPAISTIPPAGELIDPAILAQTALGQRDVRAAPLQMALVAAAIANDGVIMTPYAVAEVVDSEGDVVDETVPSEWRRAVSPATARVITDMMIQVVTAGTGRAAAVSGATVAGKTGTAEVPGGAPHAWFIGFAALGDGAPGIALAVIVESGGAAGDAATGGSVAAPIAQVVLAEWLAGQSP